MQERGSLGQYVNVLDYALIRAKWYETDGNIRYLNESIDAIESCLFMFKHIKGDIDCVNKYDRLVLDME